MKLSICIATLNRAKFIGMTLESIVSQISEDVEVVIVDGASTDNTGEIVKGFQDRFPFIRYKCLPEKGGIDHDYSLAAELAQGEYCWFFSDDDLLVPGAVKAVLGAISSSKFDLVVVNSEIRSVDMSTVLKPKALEVDTDILYTPNEQEDLFIKVANYMSFIGCVVIRKACWAQRDRLSYYGSWFVHMGVIFQRPLGSDTLLLHEPYIAIRYGNATWSSRSFEISLFKWPELIWSFSSFSTRARQSVTQREPWTSLMRLFILRARGAYGEKEYGQYLRDRLPIGIRRLVARLNAWFPGVLANTVMLLYFWVARRMHVNAELQLCDLRNSQFYYRAAAKRFFSGRPA
jgi:abequosyltransferase